MSVASVILLMIHSLIISTLLKCMLRARNELPFYFNMILCYLDCKHFLGYCGKECVVQTRHYFNVCPMCPFLVCLGCNQGWAFSYGSQEGQFYGIHRVLRGENQDRLQPFDFAAEH